MEALERLHQDWLGMAQPEGLVVTASVLKQAGANITWPIVELQEQLRVLVGDPRQVLDLRRFLREICGWDDEFVVESEQLPDSLRFKVEGGGVLEPRLALRSADDPTSFVMLVGQETAEGSDLDRASDDPHLPGTAAQRFERLLRESGVYVGLLTNGWTVRLVYAPKGETAGWINFRLKERVRDDDGRPVIEPAALLKVDGRPLLGALHMLLNQGRLLTGDPEQRLTGLLKASREYQNTVSEKLREQVLAALRELLTGFQDADRISGGEILRDYQDDRKAIYSGLVTTLMRMIFGLYAEERKLLPMDSEIYANNYSLTQLYGQLLHDRDRFGADALDNRYGAWARIITLFRVLHDGVNWFERSEPVTIPARRGSFFDPDAFPFLEGRARAGARQTGAVVDPPKLSDGVLFRVLNHLLLLNGERLQYKGLDVEQIGSVYEGLMGFDVKLAEGESIPLTSHHVVVDLEWLLAKPAGERVKELKELGVDAKGKIEEGIKKAATTADLRAALSRRIPDGGADIPKGALYLQPGEERRRTGSHYTPRKLTQPIVETTLRPVLEQLGPEKTPEQILALRVCDPAMGSGAFLVEACRQLGDHLVAAWRLTGTTPPLPADEDVTLHAYRLIAQQCLYGVDKNPLAVDLARLSMWLLTFAKLHPFTFVDHALRNGDSLVGLSREQIASFSLDTSAGTQIPLVRPFIEQRVREVEELRRRIHAIGDPPDIAELTDLWKQAQEKLYAVRLIGDLVVAAFFARDTDKARRTYTQVLAEKVSRWLQVGEGEAELRGGVAEIKDGARAVPAFHWEIEFPEVFRGRGGFDCFIGNPPFLGGSKISTTHGSSYLAFILFVHPDSNGNADLVAHFFRRAFALVREGGALGLIATNSVSQGDSRKTGLRWMCANGGVIYAATRRLRWPGAAAVVVSIVHVIKGDTGTRKSLDGMPVERISAYLFHRGGDEDPSPLPSMLNRQFKGSSVNGEGFVLSLDEGSAWLSRDPSASAVILPYMDGENANSSPSLVPQRFVICFREMSKQESMERWPSVMSHLHSTVRVQRERSASQSVRDHWWLYERYRPALYRSIRNLERVLVCSRHQHHWSVLLLPSDIIFSDALNVFASDSFAFFSALQSNIHEIWARFLGSTMKDDLRYTPSECFETFPLPQNYEPNENLEEIGKNYYEYRARLMQSNSEGVTKTYNRFHDRDARSPEIARLRELHIQMDRAVLDAYDWTDIKPAYDFRSQVDQSERFTWSEDTRDEVLARLLELNQHRASEENGKTDKDAPAKKKAGKGRPKRGGDAQLEIK